MRKGAAAGTALGLLAVGALSGCGIVGIAGLIDTEIRKEVKVSASTLA